MKIDGEPTNQGRKLLILVSPAFVTRSCFHPLFPELYFTERFIREKLSPTTEPKVLRKLCMFMLVLGRQGQYSQSVYMEESWLAPQGRHTF